jgi:hypothetical protein
MLSHHFYLLAQTFLFLFLQFFRIHIIPFKANQPPKPNLSLEVSTSEPKADRVLRLSATFLAHVFRFSFPCRLQECQISTCAHVAKQFIDHGHQTESQVSIWCGRHAAV